MYTIIYIKPTKNEGYLTLGIDVEGERIRFCVKEEVLTQLGIHTVPASISEEAYLELKAIADRHEALKSALSLLAYADNSRRQLYVKLRRRGYSDELVRGAIAECERLGYLNEERQLENLVRSLATGKLFGKERIVSALFSKGYSQGSIQRTIERLCEEGELDFDALCNSLLERHHLTDRDTDEARALLYRYGYRD